MTNIIIEFDPQKLSKMEIVDIFSAKGYQIMFADNSVHVTVSDDTANECIELVRSCHQRMPESMRILFSTEVQNTEPTHLYNLIW